MQCVVPVEGVPEITHHRCDERNRAMAELEVKFVTALNSLWRLLYKIRGNVCKKDFHLFQSAIKGIYASGHPFAFC